MFKPAHFINSFVMEKALSEPLAKRILIYRALSSLVGEEEQSKALRALAADLEMIDRRSEQLRLNLGEEGKP